MGATFADAARRPETFADAARRAETFADAARRAETFADAARRAAGIAAAQLGWRPGEFWAATPAELAVTLGLAVDDPAAALDGARLARLMEAFPDGQ